MSTHAREYYDQRSERFDLTTPPRLLGDRISLAGPDTVIPMHTATHEALVARALYDSTLREAGTYIWKIVQSGLGEEQKATADYSGPLSTHSLICLLIDNLVPKKHGLRTGELSNIGIEAVAMPELDPDVIALARQRAASSKRPHATYAPAEDTEVYFVTSADATTGTRKLGRCAFLTLVGSSRYKRPQGERTVYHTKIGHAALPGNTEIIRSGLSAPRAVRSALDAFAIQNPLVNNVGRGKGS